MHKRPVYPVADRATTARVKNQISESYTALRTPNLPPTGRSRELVDDPFQTQASVRKGCPKSPKHRYVRPASTILKTTRRTMKEIFLKPASKVRFSNLNSEWQFEKSTPSCRLQSSSSTPMKLKLSDSTGEGTDVSLLAAAIKAVRSNEPENLTKYLQEIGHVDTAQFVQGENWLSREYDFAKMNGFERIRVILSILKSASMAIKIAQSMKSWCAYRIHVEKISGLELTKSWASELGNQSFSGSIQFFANGKGKDLSPLPPMDFTQNVDYGSGGVAALPEYNALHFNAGLPDESRELLIQLHSIKGEKRTLARQGIPMMGVHAHCCYSVGKDVSIEREFPCSEFIQSGAKLHLQARKLHVSSAYIGK